MSRLDNIFLTRMHWSNVGGLCGESLALFAYLLSPGELEFSVCPASQLCTERGQLFLRRAALNMDAALRVTIHSFTELLDWRYVTVNWRV